MKSSRLLKTTVPLLILTLLLSACSGSNRIANLGVQGDLLTPCPSSPNCVSSDARDTDHQIAPFILEGSADVMWGDLHDLVTKLPRTKIITDASDYLHAECRSAVFGFVDDLEFHLRPDEGVIAVRSAARSGYSDFGVNRQRIEELRTALKTRGMTP